MKLPLAVDGAISLCAHKTSVCEEGGVADERDSKFFGGVSSKGH